jgi:hypothetical protein
MKIYLCKLSVKVGCLNFVSESVHYRVSLVLRVQHLHVGWQLSSEEHQASLAEVWFVDFCLYSIR